MNEFASLLRLRRAALSGLGLLSAFPVVVGSFGCDAQVGPEYEGEPITVLHGALRNESTQSSGSRADVGVAWFSAVKSGKEAEARILWRPVSVQLSFPGTFDFPLYSPPPAEVYFPDGGDQSSPRFAIGTIEVVPTGTAVVDDTSSIGGAQRVALLYLEGDVLAGTCASRFFGVRQGGYHLISFGPPTNAAAASALKRLDIVKELQGCFVSAKSAGCPSAGAFLPCVWTTFFFDLRSDRTQDTMVVRLRDPDQSERPPSP